MKALTIKQPWADAIAYGDKNTENRVWPAPAGAIGTRILIHAGKGHDPMGRFLIDWNVLDSWPDARGAFLAVATLAGCHPATENCCRPWGEPRVFHWQFTDIQPLASPVPCGGAQRLWAPPAHVLRTVHAKRTAVR